MRVIKLPCGPIAANSYIVYKSGSPHCAVIDPADAALIFDETARLGVTVSHILVTHGHFDHIFGLAALKERTGALVYAHPDDAELLRDARKNFSAQQRTPLPPVTPDALVGDGDVIEAAGLSFRVLHTPGHTRGGVSFYVAAEHAVFTGDTLFCQSVGRTDLPGGSARALMQSIVDKLMPLPDDTIVYPGHEEDSTIGRERVSNPFLLRRNHPWFA